MDIEDGYDTVLAALKCDPPRVCDMFSFFPGIFPKKLPGDQQMEAGIKMDSPGNYRGIRSAEQFGMLAKMGLARDLRNKDA